MRDLSLPLTETQMHQPQPSSNPRRPYDAPSLERVILDPIKEMLTACTTDPVAKNDSSCNIQINTNS